MTEQREPVYFGNDRTRGTGHGLFTANPSPLPIFRARERHLLWIEGYDDKLTPRTSLKQGAGALHYIHGYYVLAFHDYTGDSRPGSNSAFWIPAHMVRTAWVGGEGVVTANAWEKVLEKARELWPWVFRRELGIFEE